METFLTVAILGFAAYGIIRFIMLMVDFFANWDEYREWKKRNK